MHGGGLLGTLDTVSRTAVTGRARADAAGAIPRGGTTAPTDPHLVDAAEAAVARQTRLLGVHAVELTDSVTHHRAAAVLQRIWGNTDGPPLSPEMLRAFAHTGNYVAAVFDGDEMVGVAVAFRTDHESLHSHIAGVLPTHQGRQAGYLLKLHQRAWALRHGIGAISWTFDPLVRRNAYFNLVKLGAVLDGYLPDFYGSMADAINAGIASDRMVALWRLDSPVPGRAVAPGPDAIAVLQVGEHEEPVPAAISAPTAERTIALPSDIEAMRHVAPETAGRWRYAVREAIAACEADGFRISGFTPDGAYLARQEHRQ